MTMRKMHFYHSIRFKFVALLLVVATVPASFVYLIYSNVARNIIIEKYTQSAVQSVYEMNQKIDQTLTNIIDFTDAILINQDFRDSIRSLNRYQSPKFKEMMGNFLISREDVAGIYVYANSTGTSQYFGVSKTLSINYISSLPLQQSTGEILWLPTKNESIKILSGQFEKYYFTFARKIIDLDTMEQLGLMAIDLDESLLTEASLEKDYDQPAKLFFFTNDGLIVSAVDKSLIGNNLSDVPGMKSLKNHLSGQKDAHGYFEFDYSGKRMIAIYANNAITGWKMVKMIPVDYLYSEITYLDRLMLTALIGFALMGILAAGVFSMFLTRPIINLMHSMKLVENGNLSARVTGLRKDELGKLGQSFNFMIEKMGQLIERVIDEERTKKELEMEVLHAQINPHFLYNTLNTIGWMARIQDAPAISDAVVALIKLLRISINLGQETIALSDEIEYVRNYCLIQEFRFNNHFTVEYHIDPACHNIQIPKLVLQPIVENSIVYGSENHSGNFLNIVISATIEAPSLLITVADNGPGIAEEKLRNLIQPENTIEKFSKVGLNNVQQRLKLFFGSQYGLDIHSGPGTGTIVTIKIPLSERVNPSNRSGLNRPGHEAET